MSTNDHLKIPQGDGATKKGHKGFIKGASGNPKGRPKGSRNKATLIAKAVFDQNSEAVAQKIVDLALKKGDMTALKLIIDRVVPPLKSHLLTFDLPEIATAQDVVAGYSAVVQALSRGELTAEEANMVANLLEAARRAIDTADITERLARIEHKLGVTS
jgi:polyhydroxyalkanoate synthesis regulator phasin